jgi:catalase
MARRNDRAPTSGAEAKQADLERDAERASGTVLTTNQGLAINDDQNSLKAGERGPTLLEDFHLREKITHFDHERIPERVVHARGAAAHGVFRVYKSLATLTRARFLQDPGVETPVFVRFSTVAGSRGSTDLARDVRGFAVKFYTSEGNFDLVGNNMPVFFIQDALKFPDLIHAVKPEPHHEIPQAASAHDTFWDFISLMPESMHMIMWVMSDRAIPRSLRMMEGFGVHTFRFVDDKGQARFVKFHWKPLLGVHSVLWDEATLISGKDPDFHRRDLWEAIEGGAFPEWEFGVQVVEEKDEHKFDFDLLDPTKLIPEELVPVQRIGRLTLNRNPDNFFAETEQVAFHPGHLVPGIDFSNDPLLQGRLFSYLDTQLTRLGGPNFHEIPINRTVAPMHNNQRDGHMRQAINHGRTSYQPNTLGGGCPVQAGRDLGGFVSHAERIDAVKIRARSPSFFDHFSQAALFFASQAPHEQDHIVNALRFELGKVQTVAIRERMVGMLSFVDQRLAERVAAGLGLQVTLPATPLNHSVPADGDAAAFEPRPARKVAAVSPALSMARPVPSVATRKVAVLTAPGCHKSGVDTLTKRLAAAGMKPAIVGPRIGAIVADSGEVTAEFSLLTASSVLFDAVYVPGGASAVNSLLALPDAINFVREAYRHCKPIAATGDGIRLVNSVIDSMLPVERGSTAESARDGVITGPDDAAATVAKAFVDAMAQHRFFAREALFAPPEDDPDAGERPPAPRRARPRKR